jgi:hypothetical protein
MQDAFWNAAMTGVLLAVGVARGAEAQEMMPPSPLPTLPFTVKVTEEKLDPVPPYMGKDNPGSMDFPFGPINIDGDFWIIYWNPAGKKTGVLRFKGTNIENAVRQPDGDPKGLPTYLLGGLYYDKKDKRIYAPLHRESPGTYKDGRHFTYREVHLACSDDMGMTWKNLGPIITENLPGEKIRKHGNANYSQTDLVSGGDGDHLIYVDEPNGYVYVFTDHYTWGGARFQRHCVARCAIADKMEPSKWRKFYNGAWDEPALGGKASYVNGYCVTYNTYLKKYISFHYLSGISYCTDLSKQDWSPSFHMGDYWGANFDVYAFWPTNAEKNDTRTSGSTLYVYTFFMSGGGRRMRIDLGEGVTKPDLGYTPSSVWFYVENRPMALLRTMTPGHLFDIDPFAESCDPIEGRKTRRVDCLDPQVKYAGTWTVDEKPDSLPHPGKRPPWYATGWSPSTQLSASPAGAAADFRKGLYVYQGKGKAAKEAGASIEWTFTGKDVYWRALKGPKEGKADVYIDGVLQTTVDCSASHPCVFQFAFIKRGLTGPGPHTIKVVVKGEKGQLSTGTAITHLLFEGSVEE